MNVQAHLTTGEIDLLPNFTGENLVFIVGAPRSGTTWLQRLLASHSHVHTGQETHLFSYVAPLIRKWRKGLARELSPDSATGRGGVGLGCYLSEDEYLGSVRLYLDSLLAAITREVPDGDFFLEKTPGHALYMSEIKELLPRSRFIHLIRDPRDVVASLLAASSDWGGAWAPKQSNRAALQWVKHVRAARLAAQDLSAAEYCEVRYEDLLSDPVPKLELLAHFIGIDWDRASVEQAVAGNSIDAARKGGGTPIPLRGEFGQRSGPVVMDPPAFIRKARAGGWKNDLSFWQKVNVWRLVRRTMAECGYSWPLGDWR